LGAGGYSRRDSHALKANEFQVARLLARYLKAKGYGFANFHHEFVQ